MFRIISTSLILLIANICLGQTFDVSFFEGSVGAVKSEMDKNLADYRKIKKENEQWLKSQEKEYKTIKDSLEAISYDTTSLDLHEDSLAILEEIRKEQYLYTDTLFSYQDIASWDEEKKSFRKELVANSRDLLEANPYLKKYTNLNTDLLNFRKEYKTYKDSLNQEELHDYEREYFLEKKRDELAQKYNQKLENYAEQELKQSKALNLPTDSPEMQRLQEMNELAKAASIPSEELANTAAPSDDFFGDKIGALQGAVQQTDELKEKYSKVLDASDLKTATKRNSMKGKSIGERLILGGNFQLRINEQTSVDISPELQYLINKKWGAGIGGNYRANGDLIDLGSGIEKTQVYGYTVLTEYFLVSGFYAHLSFESLSNGNEIPDLESQKVNVWHHSLLAGVERQFKIRGKLKGQVSILYNFMHKTNPLNTTPWNVRFGVSSILK